MNHLSPSTEQLGGGGRPKEGMNLEPVEVVRRRLLDSAENYVDFAMSTPPYREVASLVLNEMASATPVPNTIPGEMPPVASDAVRGEG